MRPRVGNEVFAIGSGLRPAPTYENNMPIAPRKRGCLIQVGIECPVIAVTGVCDPDNAHHLFFNASLYRDSGEDHVRLMKNPLMIVEMARCRHNSSYKRAAHSLYDFVPPPPRPVAREANTESSSINTMAETLSIVKRQIAPYGSTNRYAQLRACESHTVWEKARTLRQLIRTFDECASRVDSINLIPRTIVGRKLEELHAERRRLRLKAFGASTDLLPYPVAAELAA